MEEQDFNSIFRFSWFDTIWFYSPSSSFPRDKKKAGCFLDIVDSTGDRFSNEILPVDIENKIPIYRNPVILVRSVVRSRSLDSTHALSCAESQADFKFYSRSGLNFFGREETAASPCDLTDKSQISSIPLRIPPIFTHIDSDINEHDIDQPLSLSNESFLEESSD